MDRIVVCKNSTSTTLARFILEECYLRLSRNETLSYEIKATENNVYRHCTGTFSAAEQGNHALGTARST